MSRRYKLEIISQRNIEMKKNLKIGYRFGEYTQYLSHLDHDLPKDIFFEGLKAEINGQRHRVGGLDMFHRRQLTMKRNEYNKGYI